MSDTQPEIHLRGITPILAVRDIPAAAEYYKNILGFEIAWLWGDPPNHGAVKRGQTTLQLSLDPQLADKSTGQQHFIFVDGIDALHAEHQRRGADIISPLENKPWGMSEYTVRDPSGYRLRFAASLSYQRPQGATKVLPASIRIVERIPTIEEFIALTRSVGWNSNFDSAPRALNNSLYGVVAIDTASNATVGMLRIVGDGARFYYIQDVMVLTEYQGKKIGSTLMKHAMAWLHRTAPKGAFIGLFTGRPAFYEPHGFKSGGGMSMGL